MLTLEQFEKELKEDKLKNAYIFFGPDEWMIKSYIKKIKDLKINSDFGDLNYTRIEGEKADLDGIINDCETVPFMSDCRMVEVYRANFLRDGKKEDKMKDFDGLKSYLKNIPPYTTLVMYCVFDGDREKPGSKLKSLEKSCAVVQVSRLKGQGFQSRVKSIFDSKGKNIGRAELTYFCSIVDNNMSIVEHEVEKLILYTDGREISKEDITKMYPYEKENDVFNLVSYLSDRNIKGAIDILNELIYKGEKPTAILNMIERQFKLMFVLKVSLENRVKKEQVIKEYKMNPYIAEKMIAQGRRFSVEALEKNMQLCLETEKQIKSTAVDVKNAIEMLIVRTMMNR